MAKAKKEKHERHENDAYYTPGKTTRLILKAIGAELRLLMTQPDFRVVEPSAGTGSIVRELIRWGVDPSQIEAVDLDERALEKVAAMNVQTHCKDFRLFTPKKPCTLVMGNPPYGDDLPVEFHRHIMSWKHKPRMVVMLLRLNWLGAQGRLWFHRQNPSDVYVLPERPSYTGDGQTDGTEYAWFVWCDWLPGGHYFLLDIIDPMQLQMFGEPEP